MDLRRPRSLVFGLFGYWAGAPFAPYAGPMRCRVCGAVQAEDASKNWARSEDLRLVAAAFVVALALFMVLFVYRQDF